MLRFFFFIIAICIDGTYGTTTTVPYSCYGIYSENVWCDTRFSIDERINALIKALRLDEKAILLTARESPLNFIARLGISEYDWGANCIYAAKTNCGTRCPSVFPMTPNLAATFNLTLIRNVASVIARELRSLYLQGVGEARVGNLPHTGLDCWGPTINIARDPRWGRNYETPGEDPLLNGYYGVYFTLGLQNGSETYNKEYFDDRYYLTVATLKHYDAYSLEYYNSTVTRHSFNAIISKYMLNDTYLPAFERSIKDGGAKGVMCSYNAVNGVPSCANSYLMNDIMRGEWGYNGYITSDSSAIRDIYENHHYTSTLSAAVASAMNATCDLNSGHGIYAMGEDYATDSPFQDYMVSLVQNGTVSESTLDAALYRLFNIRFSLGLFDPIDNQSYWQIPDNIVNNEESQELNKFASKQSIILLKNGNDASNLNDDILPFNINKIVNNNKKIAVIGPHFNATQNLLHSGYTPPVCMDQTYDCVPSILTELINQLGSDNGGENSLLYSQGCNVECTDTSQFDEAITIANKSDYIVLMMGLDTITVEHEGVDRVNISLPGYQYDLAMKLCNLNKPSVLVMLNGGMIGIDDLANKCNAIIEAHYPGFYGSSAIWDVIFGNYNPNGKLVMTMYYSNFTKISSMLEMNMNVSPGKTYKYFNQNVIFPFAWGLSYTKFNLQAVSQAKHENTYKLEQNDFVFKVNLTNEGPMDGCETIFVMMTPLDVPSDQAASTIKRKLVAFEKMCLQVSQQEMIQFTITNEDLELVNNDGVRQLFSGSYQIVITNGATQSLNYTVTPSTKQMT